VAHGPAVLLLDEPTAGLDVQGVDQLTEVLREEAARGTVVVMITHDSGLASSLGTRRLRLERGRLVLTDVCRRESAQSA
jgi:ABC-type multidrug transport system ATPase subunit